VRLEPQFPATVSSGSFPLGNIGIGGDHHRIPNPLLLRKNHHSKHQAALRAAVYRLRRVCGLRLRLGSKIALRAAERTAAGDTKRLQSRRGAANVFLTFTVAHTQIQGTTLAPLLGWNLEQKTRSDQGQAPLSTRGKHFTKYSVVEGAGIDIHFYLLIARPPYQKNGKNKSPGLRSR